MSRILVIDDDAVFLKFLNLLLKRKGHEVTAYESGADGLKEAMENDYDLILSDIFMPGVGGLELTREVRAAKPDQSIVLMSAGISANDTETIEKARDCGAFEVLQKEDVPKQLLGTIQSAINGS